MRFTSSILFPLHLLRDAINAYLPDFSQPCSPSSENDQQFNLKDFEVDYKTGFLPPQHPISSLPEEFDLWESALASAHDCLSLGEDKSAAAVAKRESSRRWRQALESVSRLPLLYCTWRWRETTPPGGIFHFEENSVQE